MAMRCTATRYEWHGARVRSIQSWPSSQIDDVAGRGCGPFVTMLAKLRDERRLGVRLAVNEADGRFRADAVEPPLELAAIGVGAVAIEYFDLGAERHVLVEDANRRLALDDPAA